MKLCSHMPKKPWAISNLLRKLFLSQEATARNLDRDQAIADLDPEEEEDMKEAYWLYVYLLCMVAGMSVLWWFVINSGVLR